MKFPATVAGALQDLGGNEVLSGIVSTEADCEGAKFHSPTPLLIRKVTLVPTSWVDGVILETVWLCGVCADNLEVLLYLLQSKEGELPWGIKREFGNLIRALAMRSWERYQAYRGG